MAISQLEQAMATLRLGLAEMRNKEEQLDAQIYQFKTQLRRLPRQVVYGKTSLDASLAAMGEIEERLEDATANQRRLSEIIKTASQELEALQLLKSVDDARSQLASLKRNSQPSGEDTQLEIRRLEEFIAASSRQAEQAITDGFREKTADRAGNRANGDRPAG